MWVDTERLGVVSDALGGSNSQDKDNLFLVLDYHPGGDLATQLSRWGRLGRDRARFYTAEISAGLEELHHAGVIYR